FGERMRAAVGKMAVGRGSKKLDRRTIPANPERRPLGRAYQQIAALRERGKRKRDAHRLARVQATRTTLAARMSDIDDYMSWFEATQSKTGSGVFVDYLGAVGESQIPAPRRRDPLSVYLDSVDEQFED